MNKYSIHRNILAHGCAAVALITPAVAWAADPAPTNQNEIVVTAQHRAQRLEDVPMSITAITPQAAEQRGIRNLQDLGQSVAGLQINFQGTFTYPAVRGISSLTTGVGFENNIGVYIDGFYQPDVTAINADFANLESIEVLKGPQGSLYGRNATGGAILINTLAPSKTLTGKLDARYGNFNDKVLSGFISGPVTNGIRLSLAGYAHAGDGYYALLDANGNRIGNAAPPHTYSIRAKAAVDLAPNLTATVGYNYLDFRDDRGAMFNNESARSAALPAQVGMLYQPRTFATNHYTLTQTVMNEGTGKIVWGTSIGTLTSYTYRKYKGDFDFDGSYADYSFSYVRQFEDTFQQGLEFNVKGVKDLDLIVGATYYNDTVTSNPSAAYSLNALSSSTYLQYKTTAYAGFVDGTYHLTKRLSFGAGVRYTSEKRESAYAATLYSHGIAGTPTTLDPTLPNSATHNNLSPRGVLTYEVADRTNVYGSVSRGFRSGFLQPQAFPGFQYAQTIDIKPETITAYEVGFKTVQENFRFDTSAFYYNYSNIQVGATVTNPLCSSCGPINLIQNAAKAEVYGLEAQLSLTPIQNLHVDLTGAYLHARYKNFADYTGTGFNVTTGHNVSGQIQDLSGHQMARAPDFSATLGLDYKIPDVFRGSVDLIGNVKYTSSYIPNNISLYGSLDPAVANVQRYRQGQYALVNGAINWTDASNTVTLGVWANNLTNVNYRLSDTGGAFGNYGTWASPRTYGLRAGVKW